MLFRSSLVAHYLGVVGVASSNLATETIFPLRPAGPGSAGRNRAMHATHTSRRLIRFSHCDPAGIVFYPQFFYILSECKEEFLGHIGQPMHRMINAQRMGWPMVTLSCARLGRRAPLGSASRVPSR